MSNVTNLNDLREAMQMLEANRGLKSGDGGGTSGGMSADHDIHGRLSRLEGGNAVLLGAVAIVSAVLIGGMAIVAGIQINSQQQAHAQYADLNAKVDALPGQINQNILALTSSFAEVIAASRAPNVIEIRPGSDTP